MIYIDFRKGDVKEADFIQQSYPFNIYRYLLLSLNIQ